MKTKQQNILAKKLIYLALGMMCMGFVTPSFAISCTPVEYKDIESGKTVTLDITVFDDTDGKGEIICKYKSKDGEEPDLYNVGKYDIVMSKDWLPYTSNRKYCKYSKKSSCDFEERATPPKLLS